MRAELVRFLRGVDLARRELSLMEAVADATRVSLGIPNASTEVEGALRRIQEAAPDVTELQRSGYSRAIVALYGFLERYVEELARDTVERFALIAHSYDELPAALLRHHTPLTLEVLNAISAGRYNGDLLERDLVAGLQFVLEKYSSPRLNSGVYSSHSSNVRADTIRQMFERVGVSLVNLQRDQGLTDLMAARFPGEGNIFFVLDDLAQRRNEVAHGADSEILSFELLRAYADVCAEYGKALAQQVASALTHSAVRCRGAELGRPSKVFKDGLVIGYTRLSESVENGDVLAVLSGSGTAMCVNVLELQSNAVTVGSAAKGTAAGIRLSAKASTRSRVFLLPPELSYLVLPAR